MRIASALVLAGFLGSPAIAPFGPAVGAGRLATPGSWVDVPGGRRSVSSVIDVPHAMRFGEWRWDDAVAGNGGLWIRVDVSRQIVSAFAGSDEIGTAVIMSGADGMRTPTGRFTIMERRRRHRSSSYDAEMPYMLRLTSDGVSIHAASVRSGWATHGCIGVPEEFARRLFARARVGVEVLVVESPRD